MGRKYDWKPNNNPGPGTYELDKSANLTQTSSPAAKMHEPMVPEKRYEEPTP